MKCHSLTPSTVAKLTSRLVIFFLVYSKCCSGQVYDFEGYRREIYINEWDNKDTSRSLPAFSTGNLGPYNALEKAILAIRDQMKDTGINNGIRFLDALVNNQTNVTLSHNGTIDLTQQFWTEYKAYLLQNHIDIDEETVLEAVIQWISNLGNRQFILYNFFNLPSDHDMSSYNYIHKTVNFLFAMQVELQKHDAMLRNLMFAQSYQQQCLELKTSFVEYRQCICRRAGCASSSISTQPTEWRSWGVSDVVNYAQNGKNVIQHGNLGSYFTTKVATNPNIPAVFGWILDPTIMWKKNRNLYEYSSDHNARLLRIGDRRFTLSQQYHQQYADMNSLDTNKDFLYEYGHRYERDWHADYRDGAAGHGDVVDYHHDDAIITI